MSADHFYFLQLGRITKCEWSVQHANNNAVLHSLKSAIPCTSTLFFLQLGANLQRKNCSVKQICCSTISLHLSPCYLLYFLCAQTTIEFSPPLLHSCLSILLCLLLIQILGLPICLVKKIVHFIAAFVCGVAFGWSGQVVGQDH